MEKKAKIVRDFEQFLQRRAELVMVAIRLLVAGRQLSYANIYQDAVREVA